MTLLIWMRENTNPEYLTLGAEALAVTMGGQI